MPDSEESRGRRDSHSVALTLRLVEVLLLLTVIFDFYDSQLFLVTKSKEVIYHQPPLHTLLILGIKNKTFKRVGGRKFNIFIFYEVQSK